MFSLGASFRMFRAHNGPPRVLRPRQQPRPDSTFVQFADILVRHTAGMSSQFISCKYQQKLNNSNTQKLLCFAEHLCWLVWGFKKVLSFTIPVFSQVFYCEHSYQEAWYCKQQLDAPQQEGKLKVQLQKSEHKETSNHLSRGRLINS